MNSASFAWTSAFGGFIGLDGRHFQTRLPAHVHSTYVLGVVDAGSLLVSVAGREFVARPGSVLALPPFTAHRELPLSGHWSFRYLYPSETAVRLALNLPEAATGAALPFASPVIEDAALAGAIGYAHALLRHGAGGVEDVLASLFRLARERHCISAIATRVKRHRLGVLAVRDLITSEPRPGMTLDDMARVSGLSRFRFAHAFREEFGMAPYSFYEQVRIAFAHKMIEGGETPSVVAFKLGFADQSHMTRHFRRGSFTTPGRFASLTRKY